MEISIMHPKRKFKIKLLTFWTIFLFNLVLASQTYAGCCPRPQEPKFLFSVNDFFIFSLTLIIIAIWITISVLRKKSIKFFLPTIFSSASWFLGSSLMVVLDRYAALGDDRIIIYSPLIYLIAKIIEFIHCNKMPLSKRLSIIFGRIKLLLVFLLLTVWLMQYDTEIKEILWVKILLIYLSLVIIDIVFLNQFSKLLKQETTSLLRTRHILAFTFLAYALIFILHTDLMYSLPYFLLLTILAAIYYVPTVLNFVYKIVQQRIARLPGKKQIKIMLMWRICLIALVIVAAIAGINFVGSYLDLEYLEKLKYLKCFC